MNTYKKLVGEELLLKIKSFGKLDNNNINRAIFLCGYYRKNNANEIILDPEEFAKAYKNAKSKKKNNLDTNVEERQYESKHNYPTNKGNFNENINKCALYLMRDNKSGDIKIGISNNPQRRLKEVEKQYDVGSVSLIKKTWFLKKEDAIKYEKIFHRRYSSSISLSRGGREWFTLNDQDINGFLEWMRISTEKRSYKARKISTKVWKAPKELEKDRISAFLYGSLLSLVTGIIPAIGFAFLQSEIGLFVGPCGVGIFCVTKTKKDKTIEKIYGEDGFEISKGLPIWELKSMNLWNEKQLTIPDYKISKLSDMPNHIHPIN